MVSDDEIEAAIRAAADRSLTETPTEQAERYKRLLERFGQDMTEDEKAAMKAMLDRDASGTPEH